MAHNLLSNINSAYIEAANRLRPKSKKKKVVAYVESYDVIFFWRSVLSDFEDDNTEIEVMLPSRTSLNRGKKTAMMNQLGDALGRYMIACVDADLDYLLQSSTISSERMLSNPYVVHTYVYSIENYFCYSKSLHTVCVMATLNDHDIFDFSAFLEQYSQLIHRLFLWNVWAYTYGRHNRFPLSDFADVVSIDRFDLSHPEKSLAALRQRCNRRVSQLQRQFPEGRQTFRPLCESVEALGVTPPTTYLFMRGHDLAEHVVGPVMEAVCTRLRREREAEISRLAVHDLQKSNELASYQHSCAPWQEMLRKHDFFRRAAQYQHVVERAKAMARQALAAAAPAASSASTAASTSAPAAPASSPAAPASSTAAF